MPKTSLKDLIARYMASHGEWRSKGHVTDNIKWKYIEKGIEKTYLAETVGRKCRELETEKRLAVRDKGESIEYRFLPVDKRKNYIPFSQRTDPKVLFKI